MTSTILWDKRSDERLLLQLSAVVIEAAVRPWCGATIFLQIIGYYYYYPEIMDFFLIPGTRVRNFQWNVPAGKFD